MPSRILLALSYVTVVYVHQILSNPVTPTSDEFRAAMVKNAFKHAWKGYSRFAYGHDELSPLTNGTTDSRNGWGASIFDALDTMIIMNLEEDYEKAYNYIKRVDWLDVKKPSKTFETNIRYLGGLLSAYDLRPDPLFLEKAVELADKVIMPAFDTPSGMPAAYVDVPEGAPILKHEHIVLAEFGSLQLELVHLSQLTNDSKYELAGNGAIRRISNAPSTIPGLYPMIWNLEKFKPKDSYITISGGADSFYEYLLKTNILMEGNEELQLNMWRTAVDSMQKYLRSVSIDGKVFLAEAKENYKLLQSGELVCFIAGNILLGSKYISDDNLKVFATELMDSCYGTWITTPTGLAPETWRWIEKQEDLEKYSKKVQSSIRKNGFVAHDRKYDLRPETIESLFYFYRITGDKSYQDKAWAIFEAIEKYCKTPAGYTRIGDVTNAEDVEPLDFEESYFFAETLKYLYLIFSDPNYISLDSYVFNTEAHPFKLHKPIEIQAKVFNQTTPLL